MSQTRRLGQLYAAESWLNNYRYLVNADFKAYDFESLRSALLGYVQTNYPEDFNDFINSSEYVALIDMMSFIGQNLAFRADLNLRETFLETAEVRGNVLSIARQLGYKPFRNGGARGFLRLSAINTSQNIYDSKGQNLAGQTIVWGDPLNSDFNEQFTVVLNEVLNKSNPIGRPISSITANGVVRQLYQIDQSESRTMVETFDLSARNGIPYPCELIPINIDVESQLAIEGKPNPYGYMSMLFNNDGTGYSNLSNGWFFMFKQGTLKFEDYVLTTRVENRVIDITGSNINETDIWVQSIDASGQILSTWTQVPSTVGKNIAFNAIGKDKRKVYEVITRENDSVSIKFGDGIFADIPTDNIRIWYRQSANESIAFNPIDAAGLQVSIRYIDSTRTAQDIICTLRLIDTVGSTANESLDQIKSRASRTAASQDRMITASDYNIFPEGKVGGIDKIKSINRIHSGQSVYSDFQDPTGTYRPIITLADDAFIYSKEITSEDTIRGDVGKQDVFAWIENTLLDRGTHQLYYKKYSPVTPSGAVKWVTVDSNNSSTHGYFTTGVNEEQPLRIGRGTPDIKLRTIKKNTLIKTEDGKWSKILDVYREGFGLSDSTGANTGLRANGQGSVFLNSIIGNVGSLAVTEWFPALRSIFVITEKTEILREIEAMRSFGLRYDQTNDRWRVVRADNVDKLNPFSMTMAGNNTNQSVDASWLIRFEFDSNTQVWTQVLRKDQTVFGSKDQLTFHNQRLGKGIDQTRRQSIKDTIKFLKQNDNFTKEYQLDIAEYFKLDDGHYDPKRVVLWLPGLVDGLVPDNPDTIAAIIDGNEINLDRVPFVDAVGQYTLVPSPSVTADVLSVSGRQNLKVQHNHVPLRDNRVDATASNIIDMFVLTSEYNSLFRSWIAGGAKGNPPLALTSYGIEQTMSTVVPYKSVSDSIIFHPVTYKVIFGEGADLRNKVRVRVTKSDGTRVSDAEIRSRVIDSMNQYFQVNNWDFGETFFFTDMASWLHTQLGGIISSVALIPKQHGLTPNDLFQIRCEDNELLISSATVNDVEVITSSMSITNV